jgi:pimeloyl-ACP methyl ester carboxylesterase
MVEKHSSFVQVVPMDEELAWRGLAALSAGDERLQAFHLATRLACSTPLGVQVWHRFGNPNNPPLVLLHGGSGSWMHWIKNVVPLSRTSCVYAMDLPSMGDSEVPPGALDADDLTPALEMGFEALFKGEAVRVVGFSFGALCAGLLGAKAPHLIEELIMVGAPGMGLSGARLAMRGLTPNMDESQILAIMKHNLKVMMVQDESSLDEFTLHVQYKNVSRDRLRRRRLARSDVMLSLQKSWTFPVHTIWGEGDALYQGRLGMVKSLLNDCDLLSHTLIEDAGHWVMFEQSERFNSHLQSILNGDGARIHSCSV